MSRRLGMGIERRLSRELNRIKRDIDDIKLSQLLGIKNYSIKEITTGNDPDISVTVPAFNLKEWEVTFTANTNNNAYAQLFADIDDSGASGYNQIAVYISDTNHDSTNKTTWKIEYLEDSGSSTPVSIRLYVYSVDSGTITFAEV